MTKTLCKYMEIALSIMLFGVCIYQSVVGGYLFLLVCFIYLAETVIYVLASRSQRLLKVASLVQFLQSPIAMTVLLVAVFLNGEAKYSLLLIVATAIYLCLKAAIIFFYHLDYKKNADAISYAKRYNGMCSLLYAVNLLTVALSKNMATESSVGVFLLVLILVNSLSTAIVAYSALAFLVSAFAGKTLSFKEKISAVTRFFIKFELGFILGEVFCFTAMVISFINTKNNSYFFYLGLFYSILFTARMITFFWNKSLERKETDPYVLSRKKHGILMFNSIFFLAAGDLLAISSMVLSMVKATTDVPAWFFVGFLFPFSILSFVLSMVHRKSAKIIDNAYLDARIDQALITSLLSFFAGLSYFFRYLPNADVAGMLWISLWLGVLGVITAALVFSFVRSIIGLRGGRKTQMARKEPAGDAQS